VVKGEGGHAGGEAGKVANAWDEVADHEDPSEGWVPSENRASSQDTRRIPQAFPPSRQTRESPSPSQRPQLHLVSKRGCTSSTSLQLRAAAEGLTDRKLQDAYEDAFRTFNWANLSKPCYHLLIN
jgi:hypothetical protein